MRTAGGHGRKILLLDDSALARDTQRAQLEEAGFDVRTAATVDEFDLILGSWRPDVVLTDVYMPQMDGTNVCRSLRARAGEHVPVVLCSFLPDEQLAVLARLCGADAFVSKSHGLECLSQTVRE